MKKRSVCRPAHGMVLVLCLLLCGFPRALHALEQAATPITVTDFRGRDLVFERPVSRIVCLIESALSGLYMLGEEERVVGISRNVYTESVNRYYASLDDRIRSKALPAPGNWDFINLESVVSLRPDVVILWSEQTEAIASLEQRGIQVYGVFLQRLEDVYREISALGSMTGCPSRAAGLIHYTKQNLGRIEERVRALPAERRPGVYFMWAQGPLETSCGESTVEDLIALAGARNVCASLPREHLVVNMEQILSWNPDLVVMWYNTRLDPEDLAKAGQWQAVTAVRNGRVHELPDVFLCDLWTLKFPYAVWMLAKWSHPDLFSDIDLEGEKEGMLNFLYDRKLHVQ
jgi:iron complex transport system substrate-binding protein